MKKLLFILLILPVVAFSQIKVKEKSSLEKDTLIGKINHVSLYKNDSIRIISYTDVKYTHLTVLKSLQFVDKTDSLFNVINDKLEAGAKEEMILDLGKDNEVKVYFTVVLGIKQFYFEHTDLKTGIIGKSTYITQKQWKKIYNKK